MAVSQVKSILRAFINVKGVVQGVGFRPFVYQLAHKYSLTGWVNNTSEDVQIEVEGQQQKISLFIEELSKNAPPIAHIEDISVTYGSPKGYADFRIYDSVKLQDKYQLISPDVATCAECRSEIFDPSNRRFRYPFTNCTNCGPRFTIIEDIPYDRSRTTMKKFTMCQQCQSEYDNPLNRRFHAQPNACPECGPKLQLLDKSGKRIDSDDEIKLTASLLKDGAIVAIKGLGGFLLACDATNENTILELRQRKRRPSKPLAVMLKDIVTVEQHCLISGEEAELLLSANSPIVLLRWKSDSNISRTVAPNLKYLGVMLPYTPLHYLLIHDADIPLVMTSGNLSEEPIAKDNDEALKRLAGIADYFLIHDRDIYARYDDSVTYVESKQTYIIRRARGYAPFPVKLIYTGKQVLALGADEKNTFCLTRDKYAFVSQHIGDIDTVEAQENLKNTLELYQSLFRINPQLVVHDMHPDYITTRIAHDIANTDNKKLIAVQHHHAHIASCMADNQVTDTVIGVALDGTGYGMDGKIWGGEFLIADYRNFMRWAHMEYLPLPGGEAAIKKPYRTAIAYIYKLLGKDALEICKKLTSVVPREEIDIIIKQVETGLNTPLTSSMGRLFDAVSALLGIRTSIDYEAQAAIELEMEATETPIDTASAYPFQFIKEGPAYVIKLGDLFQNIINELINEKPIPYIALKFHNTITKIILETCRSIQYKTGIKKIALSGGVFQNRLLLKQCITALESAGFLVLTHKQVPCNDGGISLGQAVIAVFRN